MFWQFAGTAFGITAALIIAGGWIFLQYRRDQMHFKLLTLALDRGLTALPGRVPAWIRSLWQGVLITLVGLGALVAGSLLRLDAANWSAWEPAPPPPPATAPLHPADVTRAAPEPPAHPDMPRLERSERLQLIGLINMCAGGVLILLGLARIGFARLERRYIDQIETPRKSAE